MTKIRYRRNIEQFRYDLSEELRAIRREKALSLEDAAAGMYLPVIVLQRMEMGRHESWSDLCKAAKFYDKAMKLVFY